MSAVLVTGAAGFIGSHFVDYFLQVDSKYEVISLDLLTYAGRKKNLELAMHSPRHTFVQGDIRDPELIARLIRERKVEKIVHFAAESHVDNSIADPGVFLDTNVLGTHNLLRCAYAAWMDGPGQLRPEFASARFVHISTDEVYGSLGPTGHFTETTPYAPNSPYSASKASSDHLVRSYNRTYGLNTITTNCSNNFGPRQHSEKLIPTVIRTALSGQSIPVYGKGQNVRDWLYVKDHVAAVHRAMESGKSGEVYNVGGGTELANLDIVKKICKTLDEVQPGSTSYLDQISFVADRPGHDFRYAVSTAKIKSELGWEAAHSFDEALRETIQSYASTANMS